MFEIDRPSGSRENSEKAITNLCIASMPKQKWIKRSLSDKLQTRYKIIYFSSIMILLTEIFQGMFSTIIIIRPCKFYVTLWSSRFLFLTNSANIDKHRVLKVLRTGRLFGLSLAVHLSVLLYKYKTGDLHLNWVLGPSPTVGFLWDFSYI